MKSYVMRFEEIDRSSVSLVGGKGAHLGALARIEGIRVPDGFCITTSAYRRLFHQTTALKGLLERLSGLKAADGDAIVSLSAEARNTVEETAVPADLAAEIHDALARLGVQRAYAVRSSATAEDSPTAAFAGQQDSYLNVSGQDAILQAVRRCWASLFTERAVIHRLKNGIDHRQVLMAVVVQHMVFPDAAGVLFTADPVSGNRKLASVEAVWGLGEAFVSGRVQADSYKVREGRVVAKTIASKHIAVYAAPRGGTDERSVETSRQNQPTLSDTQVVRLVQRGRRIEAHLGGPQDIEWCLQGDDFFIVQSRPITTLFPIPTTADTENHVYVSVGHAQMMTDAIKPLGISMWQLTTPAPMRDAGSRLFVDVTRRLASHTSRPGLLTVLGKGDPLIRDALETLLQRSDFVLPMPPEGSASEPQGVHGATPSPIETSASTVTELIRRAETSLEMAKQEILTKSGPALFDFILSDLQELKQILFDPRSSQVIMSAMEATWWLNDKLQEWLGEKNAADSLTQSQPHNVTSEMGLALLDVADAIRPHTEVIRFLEKVGGNSKDDTFLDDLPNLSGGVHARDAIVRFLDKYGMRCVGEIDITRPRFREHPATLVPLILTNVKKFSPGAAQRRFEEGRQHASQTEQSLLARLHLLPDGDKKAHQTQAKIELVRTFSGYREYPKYAMISRYFVYKEALLREAERLVQARVLQEKEDIFYLRFQELQDVARSGRANFDLIRCRKDAFKSHHRLQPPRVLTSEGEGFTGSYRRDDVPAGALLGLPVSAGTVEGRARVILDLAEADLEAGDILVTAFTDPSWTILFIGLKGLVTEVGGLMTHGAVTAREYGVPAVVGVQHATQRIRDGQRIRVNGTDGLVEILDESAPAAAIEVCS